MASAFPAMEQGKSTENVAVNAVEVDSTRVSLGILERVRCMLVRMEYSVEIDL